MGDAKPVISAPTPPAWGQMPEEITGSSFLRMTGYGAPAKRHERTVAG